MFWQSLAISNAIHSIVFYDEGKNPVLPRVDPPFPSTGSVFEALCCCYAIDRESTTIVRKLVSRHAQQASICINYSIIEKADAVCICSCHGTARENPAGNDERDRDVVTTLRATRGANLTEDAV